MHAAHLEDESVELAMQQALVTLDVGVHEEGVRVNPHRVQRVLVSGHREHLLQDGRDVPAKHPGADKRAVGNWPEHQVAVQLCGRMVTGGQTRTGG